MDRGTSWATVHGVAKSQTCLSMWAHAHTHTHTRTHTSLTSVCGLSFHWGCQIKYLGITYTKLCSLFIWNSNFTRHPAFVFVFKIWQHNVSPHLVYCIDFICLHVYLSLGYWKFPAGRDHVFFFFFGGELWAGGIRTIPFFFLISISLLADKLSDTLGYLIS